VEYNYGPADSDELIVHGASRPGFGAPPVPRRRVEEWISFMKSQSVERVCCLLDEHQIQFYDDLLGYYAEAFGTENVCWAPIEDYCLAKPTTLTDTILPFLDDASRQSKKVVVHCSAGNGRTGQVMAAWLVHARGLPTDQAADRVVAMVRNPYEAEGRHESGKAKLYALLDTCRTDAESGAS